MGSALDGGMARARGAAREGARCGTVTLDKSTAVGPCVGDGERRCFFRSRKALKRAERNGVSDVQTDRRSLPSISKNVVQTC